MTGTKWVPASCMSTCKVLRTASRMSACKVLRTAGLDMHCRAGQAQVLLPVTLSSSSTGLHLLTSSRGLVMVLPTGLGMQHGSSSTPGAG